MNKKGRIRQNTGLFNLLLKFLESNKNLNLFEDPYNSCKKTLKKYKSQAEFFNQIGINHIYKYDTKYIKMICDEIKTLPSGYIPKIRQIKTIYDYILLITNISDIKKSLLSVELDMNSQISFTCEPINNTYYTMIHTISSVITLYKLLRFDDETFYDFLLKYCNLDFVNLLTESYKILDVEMQTKNEGDINRRYIYTIRAFTITIVKVLKFDTIDLDMTIKKIALQHSDIVDQIVNDSLQWVSY